MKARATTLAVMVLSACASDGATSGPTGDTAPRTTTVASTTVATPRTTTNTFTGTLGGESATALRVCLDALVDDPSAPGAKFVETLQKLSVGYPMVEPLTAAQEQCDDASAELEAESGVAGSLSAELLAHTNRINAALELAADQIRTDGFYYGNSLPAQFIPAGAAALRQSIADFYSSVSAVLR